jgi:predicted alpha/beta-fold hydrolase
MARVAKSSPIALVGFSLGGSLVLNLAGDTVANPLEGVDCVLAAGAPIDLAACARWMGHPSRRFYDRQFLYSLIPEVRRLHARFPELGRVNLESIRSILEFDRCYTAPRNGFASVEAYHEQCSPIRTLDQIPVPGLVIHAEDDPFIPLDPFRNARFPTSIEVEILPTGGHLGFISRERWAGDRRWLVTRMAAWLVDRWNLRRS